MLNIDIFYDVIYLFPYLVFIPRGVYEKMITNLSGSVYIAVP